MGQILSQLQHCMSQNFNEDFMSIESPPQTVSDSSRYFVIAVDGAHLGLGFADRSDSFDLNVSLQDHFKGDWATHGLFRVDQVQGDPSH